MSRKQFSKSDIKKFLEANPLANEFVTKKSVVVQEDNVLLVNSQPFYLFIKNVWVPSLRLLLKKIVLPKVVVDKGAIRFVINGADVMRPGITTCEPFEKNDVVVIVDETLGKPIAVGEALFSSQDLLAKAEGKVIKNLHYVGDEYWNKK